MTIWTVAISGCGAVTEEYYVPALAARSDRLRVIGVYDPDHQRARLISGLLPAATNVESLKMLFGLGADLVVVASPPTAHAEQVIEALHYSHVLCEKPMALTLHDASAMVRATADNGRLLAVGMVRRHFPSSRLVTRFLDGECLGKVRSVLAFEGGMFRWPIRDQSYFTKEVSGGGVLADVGTHVLDLLTHWLGEAELVRYADDAMGGVEANALIELRYGEAPAAIRLSRDWDRPNQIELRLERGWICWRADNLNSIQIGFDDGRALHVIDEATADTEFVTCVGTQIDAVLDHLSGGPGYVVTADEALSSVRLIERAYCQRRQMDMPWLQPVWASAHD